MRIEILKQTCFHEAGTFLSKKDFNVFYPAIASKTSLEQFEKVILDKYSLWFKVHQQSKELEELPLNVIIEGIFYSKELDGMYYGFPVGAEHTSENVIIRFHPGTIKNLIKTSEYRTRIWYCTNSVSKKESMKKFETLYKRAKTGNIQFWEISVAEEIGHAHITKSSGKLGTDNPLVHKETITEGKNLGKANETTPHQQAYLQAESDWKKKKDEGYKDFKDLGIGRIKDGVYLGLFTINNIPVVPAKSLLEVLQETLPQFNTDASGNVKPMLAKAVDWKKVKYPCLVQPKLDGVRCLMVVERDGPDLSVVFLSRSGKPYTTLDHIKQDVLESAGSESFILDGEIYSEELSFQEIIAAVKKEREDSKKLKFRVYDTVNSDSQMERWDQTRRLVELICSIHITFVDTYSVHQQKDIQDLHDKWVQEGYEGAMIRHTDGKYGQGQRSSDLLKVKEFDETEFLFIRFETGQRTEDLIAVCKVIDDSDSVVQSDRLFRAKMIGSLEHKKALTYTTYEKGRMMIVKHFGWTEDRLPRFPIGKAFRDYE